MRPEKGESKRESSYKPLSDTGNEEIKRSSVKEKKKLERVWNDLDEKVIEDEEHDANKPGSKNRLTPSLEEQHEFKIEEMLTHTVNCDRKNKYERVGRKLHQIHWYGYSLLDDRVERIRRLRFSKVLSYFK